MPNKTLENRYDFVYLFDCRDGNPNGDPDAGNQPRLDPETLHGLVSDVCLKRKIRNFVQMRGQPIFIQHRGVLNDEIAKAEPKPKGEKRDREQAEKASIWMCKNYWDVRTFGAVMSTGSNAGQIRGPVQITFSRSIDPVVALDLSITRVAVTEPSEDPESPNQTMGRKNMIPYGLYRCHGFISPWLAQRTQFSEDDLGLLWEALKLMFDHDRSAARGMMSARALIAFKHVGTDTDPEQKKRQAMLGCAPAHKLFDLIEVTKKTDRPARSFEDYEIDAPEPGPLPGYKGVEVLRLV